MTQLSGTIQQYQKTNPNMTFTPEAASGLAALYILAISVTVGGLGLVLTNMISNAERRANQV